MAVYVQRPAGQPGGDGFKALEKLGLMEYGEKSENHRK